MPIYEYKCENGHVFDVMQKMSEDPLSSCMECGAPVRKVLHPVSISFKGSGFYSTDYSEKGPKEAAQKDASKSDNGSRLEEKKSKEKPAESSTSSGKKDSTRGARRRPATEPRPPGRYPQKGTPRPGARDHPPLRRLSPRRLLRPRRLHCLAPRVQPRPLRPTLRRPQRPDSTELVSVERRRGVSTSASQHTARLRQAACQHFC